MGLTKVRLHLKIGWYYCLIAWCLLLGGVDILYAQDPTPGGPIVPDKPKIPTATPFSVAEANLILIRHYTVPEQVRALEPFEIHLEFKNVGIVNADGFYVENASCVNPDNDDKNFVSEGICTKLIPTIPPGDSETVSLQLRYMSIVVEDIGKIAQFPYRVTRESGAGESNNIGIYVLKAVELAEPTPTLERQLNKANVRINKTWVTEARRTGYEMLTPVPIEIKESEVGGGGPEFELGIGLYNTGDVEARNIAVDFCSVNDAMFKRLSSRCHVQIPGTLPPNGHAFTSQTLVYKQFPTDEGETGSEITVTVSFEFRYAKQWVRETITEVFYIDPMPMVVKSAAVPHPGSSSSESVDDAQCRIEVPGANLRQGPGINYPIVGSGVSGQHFRITGRSEDGSWWRIDSNGTAAWIYGELVSTTGTANVALASYLPPPPATPIPVANHVSAAEAALAPTEAEPIVPSHSPAVMPALATTNTQADRAATGNIAQAATGDSSTPSNVSEPFIVIENYSTTPERIAANQPFEVTFELRNVGQGNASQLLIEWTGDQVIPIGAGRTQWMGNLAAGTNATVTGQFIAIGEPSNGNSLLPLRLQLTNIRGQIVEQNEQLLLIQQNDGGALLNPALTEGEPKHPLWLRVAFGLIGLGANP